MPITVTELGNNLSEVEFSADEDEAEVRLPTLAFGHQGRYPSWQRASTKHIEVQFTLNPHAVGATPRNDSDWSDHPVTEHGSIETDPIAGLRFKRTGSDGTKVFVDTASGGTTPYEI